jgi:peptidyl-prolyl cis-trans isomerase B (cyclophilin B)
MTCPRCNTINPVGSVACAACGTPFMQMPPGAYPPPPGQPYVMMAPMAQRTSGMAIAGFVLSFMCFLAVLGLIFSIIGYNESKNSQGMVKGEGLALAGIIISIVVLLLTLIGAVTGNTSASVG